MSVMGSDDLSRKGFRLIKGVWVSEALLYMLERSESAERAKLSENVPKYI